VAKEGAEIIPFAAVTFPQWLKPRLFWDICGAAEAAPLQNNDFFSTLFSHDNLLAVWRG
jgi:hypothetical protein